MSISIQSAPRWRAHRKPLTRISHQAALHSDKALVHLIKLVLSKIQCVLSSPITVQASLRVRKLALHSNRSYCYAFRSRAALTNTSPPVLPGGEMISPRFGLMKYIPVFHPFGVALRSKSVPDGLVTKDFAKEWNNLVYCRLSKILCAFKDQVRARPSGGTCGLRPAPAPVILVRNAG